MRIAPIALATLALFVPGAAHPDLAAQTEATTPPEPAFCAHTALETPSPDPAQPCLLPEQATEQEVLHAAEKLLLKLEAEVVAQGTGCSICAQNVSPELLPDDPPQARIWPPQ
jgi:hypothetical protein